MALLRCDFYSDVLQVATSMTVILPQSAATQIGVSAREPATDVPVLYLLHGLSDDDTAWSRQTSIERYAAARGLAVVMPQVSRSFYRDEATGNRYWTFLTDELPGVVAAFFRLSHRREDTFVAGLSMGGYGALNWALRYPARFAGAASLSGALDVARRILTPDEIADAAMWSRIFGDRPVHGSEHDIYALIRRATADAAKPEAPVPALYVCCGTEDTCYPDNVSFVETCREAGLLVTVDFGPGSHEWGYWDTKIRQVVEWLPLRLPATDASTKTG